MTVPKILVSVGTRPEAVKLAPIVLALRHAGWCETRVVATAQHRHLLDQTLDFFGIPADVDLDLMRPDQTLSDLTARMVPALDAALAGEAPDLVLTQGDTTTVFTTALACFYRDIPVGHVEAGLRTHNKRSPFPEEMNRQLVSRLADLHFAPTPTAAESLRAEGVPESEIHVTGNTVIDALLWAAKRVEESSFAPARDHRLVLVTAHRRENFGVPLEQICRAIRALADRADVEVLYPVHPNLNVRRTVEATLANHPSIRLTNPLDYHDFVAAMKASHLVLTDSGGVQEEAPSLGKPVLVMREETERAEGLAAGTSILVGTNRDSIVQQASRLLDDEDAYQAMAVQANPYGDGEATPRIVEILRARLEV